MPLVQADAMFADLIGQDPQGLRAEFDALISASFGKPPVPPPVHSRVPPHPGLPCLPSRCRRPGCAVPDAPVARPAYRRQCSPAPAAAPGESALVINPRLPGRRKLKNCQPGQAAGFSEGPRRRAVPPR
jgi:hypothetical protein